MFWRMINTRLLRRWRFDTSEVNYVKLLCWQQIIFIVLIIIGNCYQCEIANYTLENYNSEFC